MFNEQTEGKCLFENICLINHTCSLLEGTTVDTEGGITVEDGADEPRSTELATWTTLVTVMVCLIAFATCDCLVTAAPNDGNWFSWFKTNVVVEGWGLCCGRHWEGTSCNKLILTHSAKQQKIVSLWINWYNYLYSLTLIVTRGAEAGDSARTASTVSAPLPTSRALIEID